MNTSGTFAVIVAATMLTGAAFAQPYAYVPNEKSGTISIIDTATDRVTGEIKAGEKPRGIAVSPDGKLLYVSDQPHRVLNVIDIGKKTIIAKIELGESPEGVGISADGKWVVVAVEESNSIAFIDTATNKLALNLKVKGKNPEHAVFSPDVKWLYVSAEDSDVVDVIDARTQKQVASIKTGQRPRGIGFLPDSSRAYVAAKRRTWSIPSIPRSRRC